VKLGRLRENAPSNATRETPTYSFPSWDAASLLNPKGYQKSQPKDERKTNLSVIQSVPSSNMTFQFDSLGSSNALTQHAKPYPQNSYTFHSGQAPVMGMGHLVERMHNVSDRQFLPQKRRKVEPLDDQGNEQKSYFSGGGKGGVLGEYMREKKEEGRKEAVANGTRPAVDLTGGKCSHSCCKPGVSY